MLASDGTNLGTFSVGSSPEGVVYNGTNIWIANSGGNILTKLGASNGANLGAFGVGASPRRLVFDGASVWVADRNVNAVSRY